MITATTVVKIYVHGSSDFSNDGLLLQALNDAIDKMSDASIELIIEESDDFVMRLTALYALRNKHRLVTFKRGNLYVTGRYRREILRGCDVAIIFSNGKCRITKKIIKWCEEFELRFRVINYMLK